MQAMPAERRKEHAHKRPTKTIESRFRSQLTKSYTKEYSTHTHTLEQKQFLCTELTTERRREAKRQKYKIDHEHGNHYLSVYVRLTHDYSILLYGVDGHIPVGQQNYFEKCCFYFPHTKSFESFICI